MYRIMVVRERVNPRESNQSCVAGVIDDLHHYFMKQASNQPWFIMRMS